MRPRSAWNSVIRQPTHPSHRYPTPLEKRTNCPSLYPLTPIPGSHPFPPFAPDDQPVNPSRRHPTSAPATINSAKTPARSKRRPNRATPARQQPRPPSALSISALHRPIRANPIRANPGQHRPGPNAGPNQQPDPIDGLVQPQPTQRAARRYDSRRNGGSGSTVLPASH